MTGTMCLKDMKREVKEEASKDAQKSVKTEIKHESSNDIKVEVKEEMTRKAHGILCGFFGCETGRFRLEGVPWKGFVVRPRC